MKRLLAFCLLLSVHFSNAQTDVFTWEEGMTKYSGTFDTKIHSKENLGRIYEYLVQSPTNIFEVATVWTINLLEGELIEGKPAYSAAIDDAPDDAVPVQHADGRPVYQTDAGLLIGRRYREAGFGHRVCQIYCDSRAWDTSAYPHDFFDSVLIDGGHTADVVLSDTRKAFEVTRPGALIMWHDFCPDPTVLAAFTSVVGVVTALTGNWEEIAASLQDVFWVQPSFLLIGVRR